MKKIPQLFIAVRKTIRNIKIASMALMLTAVSSCSPCLEVQGIRINEQLSFLAYQQCDYCGLIDQAIAGDCESMRELSSLYFDGGYSYEHGEVMVAIVLKVGEERFAKCVTDWPGNEKSRLLVRLEVGLEYGSFPNIQSGVCVLRQFPKLGLLLGAKEGDCAQ